jgi:hypothetical protein
MMTLTCVMMTCSPYLTEQSSIWRAPHQSASPPDRVERRAWLAQGERQATGALFAPLHSRSSALGQSMRLAVAAPSVSARSFAHMIEGWTRRPNGP